MCRVKHRLGLALPLPQPPSSRPVLTPHCHLTVSLNLHHAYYPVTVIFQALDPVKSKTFPSLHTRPLCSSHRNRSQSSTLHCSFIFPLSLYPLYHPVVVNFLALDPAEPKSSPRLHPVTVISLSDPAFTPHQLHAVLLHATTSRLTTHHAYRICITHSCVSLASHSNTRVQSTY